MLNRRRFHLISTVGLILRLISFPCRIDSNSLRCFVQFIHHLLEIFGRFCDECDVVGEPCRKTCSSVAVNSLGLIVSPCRTPRLISIGTGAW
ncbi:hypothetical protein QR680_010183 [Steinernema hermaphroditum]|uniref:Secreted protein n=1 Tax=Steinernema hermaphroditum TaxID=289476 RepID=A0AA39HJV6_9BILA|nr:hypothetical protein QR680_018373 [Steinernema hermaphroditum]KAK0427353.1 hypothetical protein QR680_010183 [Steinernema hermaphroditum]